MGEDAASPATAATDISTKPRQRRRDGYFWQLIILRIPVAVFAIYLIAYLVDYAHRWQGAIRRPEDADKNPTRKDAIGQSSMPLGMAAVSLAIAVWETLAYLASLCKYRLLSLNLGLIFLDLVVVGIGIPGWLNFAMAEYYKDPDYPTPWEDSQNNAASMILVFWVLHCVMSIVGCSACCGCCCFAPNPDTSKKAALGTHATAQPLQRPDLEEAGASEPLPTYKSSSGLEEVEPVTNPDEPPSYPEAVRLGPHAKP